MKSDVALMVAWLINNPEVSRRNTLDGVVHYLMENATPYQAMEYMRLYQLVKAADEFVRAGRTAHVVYSELIAEQERLLEGPEPY